MPWNIQLQYKVANDLPVGVVEDCVHQFADLLTGLHAVCNYQGGKFSIRLHIDRPTCVNALSIVVTEVSGALSVSPLAQKATLKTIKMKKL